MKNFYIACTVEENGKLYAYAIKTSENNNLVSVLAGVKGLKFANLCPTKKHAAEVVKFWNDGYKANGTYLFDETF